MMKVVRVVPQVQTLPALVTDRLGRVEDSLLLVGDDAHERKPRSNAQIELFVQVHAGGLACRKPEQGDRRRPRPPDCPNIALESPWDFPGIFLGAAREQIEIYFLSADPGRLLGLIAVGGVRVRRRRQFAGRDGCTGAGFPGQAHRAWPPVTMNRVSVLSVPADGSVVVWLNWVISHNRLPVLEVERSASVAWNTVRNTPAAPLLGLVIPFTSGVLDAPNTSRHSLRSRSSEPSRRCIALVPRSTSARSKEIPGDPLEPGNPSEVSLELDIGKATGESLRRRPEPARQPHVRLGDLQATQRSRCRPSSEFGARAAAVERRARGPTAAPAHCPCVRPTTRARQDRERHGALYLRRGEHQCVRDPRARAHLGGAQ